MNRRTWNSSARQSCLVVVSFLLVFVGVDCRPKHAPEPNKPAVIESKAGLSEANQVAVTINGVPVTNGQVGPIVEEQLKSYADRLSQLSPEFVEQLRKNARRDVIEKIVIERLLDDEVKAQGITVSDEEMQKKIADLASKQQPPMSSEEFSSKVQAGGITVEAFQKELRRNLGYFKLFEGQWAGKVDVADQDAKAYYEQNPKEFDSPEMVRASHILIKPDTQAPGSDPNQAKALAKAKAEDLLAQIRGGADFAEMAKAHSACPSAANGGDLDYFKRGDMVAPFEKAAIDLAPGQVSGVVETEFGFHIIKVTDHKAARTLSFEEAKPGIVETLTANKKTQIIRDYLESLKAKANIQYGAK